MLMQTIRFSKYTNTTHMPTLNYSHTEYLLMSGTLLADNNGVPSGKPVDKPMEIGDSENDLLLNFEKISTYHIT